MYDSHVYANPLLSLFYLTISYVHIFTPDIQTCYHKTQEDTFYDLLRY